jgi:hypothetical protein
MRECILLLVLACAGCGIREVNAGAPDQIDWFLIAFGTGDQAPSDWSGSVEAPGGRVVDVRSWRFDRDDVLTAGSNSWKCSTRFAAIPDPRDWYVGAIHIVPTGSAAPKPSLLTNGVYVGVQETATVRVQTKQGELSFAPGEVRFGQAKRLLNGRVEVQRVAAPVGVTAGPDLEEDYPAVAVDSSGRAWIAWVAYKAEKETLYVARSDGSERKVIGEGEFFRPVLVAGPRDALHLAVAVNRDNTWKIAVASRTGDAWGALQTVSNGGPDHFARAAVDSAGRLWVAWQGFRDGRSRILARRIGDSSSEIIVGDNTRNAWEPAIATDAKGRVHFAWDAYDAGHYDIYYRMHDGSKLSTQRRVTTSPRLEAHASIAADDRGRVWIAWDEAGVNWGKDTGFLIDKNNGATRLYESRRVRMAAFKDNALRGVDFPEGHYEQPQLVAASGRVWCLARRRETKRHAVFSPSLKRDRLQQYSLWDHVVFGSTGDGWTQPITLPLGWGRNDLRAAIATGPGGRLTAAWSGDGRQFGKPYPAIRNEIYTADIDRVAAAAPPPLRAFSELAASGEPVHPEETFQVRMMRSATVSWQGRELKLLRGDMHRHTDLSFDGDIDGSLWDFYRYMIDAADFDYGALTDHNAGDDNEYIWWLIQKSCELFHYPGRYSPLFAYERSLRFPNGHRNLIWAQRGVRTLARSQAEEQGTEGAGRLYQYLRGTRGLAMSHTSATLMGTDWRDNDKDLEPLVEIYQGDRTSYEYEGAPRAARGKEPLTQPGGYQPEGFVWNAWAKGYKLGVQSSSDHASTHVSYAIILAESNTREALMKAIAARHAYAATDNVLLDFRAGDHVQGDIFSTSDKPQLRVNVLGTGPIARIDIIRNNQFVFTNQPGGSATDVTFEDQNPLDAEAYYYARLQQADGQMAWSSPIWITYRRTR